MSGRSTIIGLMAVCTVVFAIGGRAGAQDDATPIPLGQYRMEDVGTRYAQSESEVVPPAQRETLGLDDTRWTRRYGKIHPDVYRMLEKAEKIKARARNPREAYLDLGLAGTVYVQVQLKHTAKGKPESAENKAAIKQLETKVLSRLTAAEFYVECPFQTLPGILGYVNRTGLEKLSDDADVVAVCLDDKPFARRPDHVFKIDLPPLQPGDPSTQPAAGRFSKSGGKVDMEVYQALGLHERVFVIVVLKDTRPAPSYGEQMTESQFSERMSEGERVEIGVLSALTAEDFWLHGRTTLFPSLGGLVTMNGLQKLENHPDVRGVGMEDEPMR